MNIERVRAILGVWAPMAIGLFIIVTSINFYFTAALANVLYLGSLESWRLVCSAGAFFIGALLMLSTYGRYRKTKEARREASSPAPSVPRIVATPLGESDDKGDRSREER